MGSYIMDEEDRVFVQVLRAGLADDEAEYRWVDELPQDLGVPHRGGRCVGGGARRVPANAAMTS